MVTHRLLKCKHMHYFRAIQHTTDMKKMATILITLTVAVTALSGCTQQNTFEREHPIKHVRIYSEHNNCPEPKYPHIKHSETLPYLKHINIK